MLVSYVLFIKFDFSKNAKTPNYHFFSLKVDISLQMPFLAFIISNATQYIKQMLYSAVALPQQLPLKTRHLLNTIFQLYKDRPT